MMKTEEEIKELYDRLTPPHDTELIRLTDKGRLWYEALKWVLNDR